MKWSLVIAVKLSLLGSTLFNVNEAFAIANEDLCLTDCKMELQFFRRYAQDGSSIANLALAIMNYRGQGTEVDIDAGNQYLLKAARAGEPAAQYQLAYLQMNGVFMPQDLTSALAWFKKSTRYNILDSQQKVAELTEQLDAYDSPTMTIEQSASFFIRADSNNYNLDPEEEQRQAKPRKSSSSVSNQVERITVVATFSWSDVLHAAKQQTCNHPSCKLKPMVKALIPRIILKEETNL